MSKSPDHTRFLSNLKPIIFVAGLARSGSTLFQSIFSQHPNVFSFPETHFFEAVDSLHLFGRPINEQELDRLGSEILRRDGVDVEDWQIVRSATLGHCEIPLQICDVFGFLVEHYRSKSGSKRSDVALEKTPGHVFQLPQILELFPHANVFLMRRNAWDYASSMSKCPWAPDSLSKIGKLWAETIGLIDSLAKKMPERISVVDYEDLVNRPTTTMTKCFEGVGLEFRQEYLKNLSVSGARLVRSSEFSWKQQNLVKDAVEKPTGNCDLTKRQRARLLQSIGAKSLLKYRAQRLRW